MKLRLEERGDVCVLQMSGTLDAEAAGDVRTALGEVLGQGARRVVVDLAEVPFVDSVGLAALVSSLSRGDAPRRIVSLCGLTTAVRALVELTRLDRVVDVHSDVDAAVLALGEPP